MKGCAPPQYPVSEVRREVSRPAPQPRPGLRYRPVRLRRRDEDQLCPGRLRAETAALTGHPDARTRITTARAVVTGNPVATAEPDRAEALLDGDPDRLAATAQAFARAGCANQAARTLHLTG